jgi:sialate O-acetylesterase
VWEVANAQNTPNFTATGYFFGRLLHQALDIPIGLIHTSWASARIEAWMTPASLKDIPETPIPAKEANVKAPTVLYNGMLHPIVGYGIRGVIWYQGESNRNEPDLYVKMFDRMVREWRNLWGLGEFPFYYCQIAPLDYEKGCNSAFIREAQSKGMLTPNTGMAVLMDANSLKCIHPAKKKDAGERMALWALAKTYGMDTIVYRSPELASFETEGRLAVITFDLFGSHGLTTYGKDIKNFQVAGSDKKFYPAVAALAGDKVYVFSPNVAKPEAVRYCFFGPAAAELFSMDGNLPVSSFRTDEW